MKVIATGTLMTLAVSTAAEAEFLLQKPELPVPNMTGYTAKEWLPPCKAYINERSNIWRGTRTFGRPSLPLRVPENTGKTREKCDGVGVH